MIADRRQLLLFGRYNCLVIRTFNLPSGKAILRETTGDEDGFPVLLGLECFIALILDLDSDLCHTEEMSNLALRSACGTYD